MTRLRILHVILSEGFKGSERSAAEYCNYLDSAGHEVAIVVRRWPTLRQILGRGGATGSIRDHLNPGVKVLAIPRRWLAQRALRKVVAEFAPDIVHAHLTRAARLAAHLKSPVVTAGTLHMHKFDRAYLGLDAVLCVARWQKRLIPSDYRGAVFHVPNIIRPHRRLSADERAALRRELGIGESEFIIGGVGQLVQRKGWDVLIRAFMGAQMPDARLLILGAGNQRAALSTLAGNRLVLPGFRSNAKDYFQIMDLFVCPSREEAFGLVIAEALDAAVPVVASRTEGCCEILGNFPGELYGVEDVDSLRQLLSAHYQTRKPRHHVDLGEFLPHKAGSALLNSYETLLANVQRRRAGEAHSPSSAHAVRPKFVTSDD